MTAKPEWRRVSPVATVYFAVKTLQQLFDLWPVLIPALAGSERVRELLWQIGLPLGFIALLLGLVLQYWCFSYRTEPGRISLRSGVFKRKRLTLEFERVQQADISHPFYFRPFRLATLGLESAGSEWQEVDIPGIPVALAEALRRQVLEAGGDSAAQAGEASESGAGFAIRLTPGELARYGLMHNGLLYLAPLAAPLGQQAGPILESALASVQHTHWFEWVSGHLSPALGVILAALAVVAGAALLFGLSVIFALVHYWDYQLTRSADRYQYRAGLFTLRSRGFKVQKLQKVAIYQGIMARVLGRYSVQISKAGGIAQTEAADPSKFLVPVLTATGLAALRRDLALPEACWQSVSRAGWWLPAVFWSLFALLVTGLLAALIGAVALCLLLALPLVIGCLYRRWRRLGFYRDHQWLAVRTGLIGSCERWLPAGKLQKITLRQSPLARRLGLATVCVWGADGRLTIAWVPEAQALRLRDGLLSDVVTFKSPWF